MINLAKTSVETIDLADVKPMPNNARTIDEDSMRALTASLSTFGLVELIVYNKQTGHIVGGHQRYKVLMAQGVKEVPMMVVDLSPDDELALNLTLNNPEIEGDFTKGAVELLDKVGTANDELSKQLGLSELKKTLDDFFQAMAPKSFSNSEVNIDALVADCDARCPCCGFAWESEENDRVEI